jgi:hypothetical protein
MSDIKSLDQPPSTDRRVRDEGVALRLDGMKAPFSILRHRLRSGHRHYQGRQRLTMEALP